MNGALDGFAWLVSLLPKLAKDRDGKSEPIDRVLKLVRAAKIYEIESDLVDLCIRDTTSIMAACYALSDFDRDKYEQRIDLVTTRAPFPSPPCPVTFIGFTRPVDPGAAFDSYERQAIVSDIKDASGVDVDRPDDMTSKAIGLIIAETDDNDGIVAWIFRERAPSIGMGDAINVSMVYEPGGERWTSFAKSTGIWSVTSLVLSIASCCAPTEKKVTASTRMAWAKSGVKDMRPQPYYKIETAGLSLDEISKMISRLQQRDR